MTAKAWVVRGGRRGQHEQYNLEHSLTTVGWPEVGDLSGCQSRDDVHALLAQAYPEYKDKRVANIASQLWSVRGRIQPGDLIVMPLKNDPGYLRFGRVTGSYRFDAQNPDPGRRHTLPVKWEAETVSKAGIGSDLTNSLSAIMTVFSPSKNNAAERLEAIAATGMDPHLDEAPDNVVTEALRVVPEPEDEDITDPAPAPTREAIEDRVRAYITENFKGHDLTDLVADILTAHGFQCQVSPPGPDGGVDILAGMGPFGMDSPVVVVEVKSSPNPVDSKVLRGLHSARERYKADQALLVAWGGVNSTAQRQFKEDRAFRIWDGVDLMEELFLNYEQLPAETRALIPLQRAWVLDEDAVS